MGYEADPLECPKCKGPMRIIALIDDPLVVRRILEHLGLWQPQVMERAVRASHRARVRGLGIDAIANRAAQLESMQ